MASGTAIGLASAAAVAGTLGVIMFGLLGIMAGFVLMGLAVIAAAGTAVETPRPSNPLGMRFACPGCGGDVYVGQDACPACGYRLKTASSSSK